MLRFVELGYPHSDFLADEEKPTPFLSLSLCLFGHLGHMLSRKKARIFKLLVDCWGLEPLGSWPRSARIPHRPFTVRTVRYMEHRRCYGIELVGLVAWIAVATLANRSFSVAVMPASLVP